MPGVLEIAQDVLQSNVRIASPDYIGVREPQYMTGVGLIQFAFKNAKIQGRSISSNAVPDKAEMTAQREPQPQQNQQQRAKAKEKEEKKESKVKKFFGYFFE